MALIKTSDGTIEGRMFTPADGSPPVPISELAAWKAARQEQTSTNGEGSNGESAPNEAQSPQQPAQSVSNAADLIASFGEALPVVHPVEIEYFVGEELRREQYFIKELSPSEFFKVDARSIRRKSNGQPDVDPVYQQIAGCKYQIAACVVVNKGTEQEPQWVPLFSPDDIHREEQVKVDGKWEMKESGLLTNTRAAGLIYKLLEQVWRVNTGLDPLARAQLVQKMQS